MCTTVVCESTMSWKFLQEAKMQLQINGQSRQLDGDQTRTVAELINFLNVEAERGVAVAVNDQVVPRGKWGEARVGDGDRIEIIRATQGG